MLPPAPLTFSMTNGWPSVPCMWSVTTRATVSTGPPGVNGMISVIGRDGYGCAAALMLVAARAMSATNVVNCFISWPRRYAELFDLDARGLDDRPPFLNLGLVPGTERFGCPLFGRHHFLPEADKA